MKYLFKKINKLFLKILSVKSDFEKLFFKKEYLSLTEEFGINFYTIFIILLLTFSAFSFSIGSLDYLRLRMKDPFTNWVDLPVDPNVKPKVSDIIEYFEQDTVRDKIYLDNISEYVLFWRQFMDYDLKEAYELKGRTIADTSALFSKIIDKSNVVYQSSADLNSVYNKCGIILNDEVLSVLQEDINEYPKNLFHIIDEGLICLPVAAVVKDLPDNSDYVISNRLYNATKDPFETHLIVRNQTSNILKIIASSEIKNSVFDAFRKEGFDFEYRKDAKRFEYENKIVYSIILSQPRPWEEIVKSFEKVFKNRLKGVEIFWDNECYNDFSPQLDFPHYLAFNFTNLGKVRNFNNMMKDKFNVEANMTQIESKENFSLVSKLTFILSLILFVFSLISIIFFINSVLTKHLQKIKANLGTLKAFGMGNNVLNIIYLKIIFTFILVAGILAYMGNLILSSALNFFLKANLMKFYSIYILVIFIMIMMLSLLYSKLSINKVLKNTPGNLIYNRK